MKHRTGEYLNMAGFFFVPQMETIAETADRLAEGEQMKWPGSISIHGFMRPMPRDRTRRHERTSEPRMHSESVVVFDAEWGCYRRETIRYRS